MRNTITSTVFSKYHSLQHESEVNYILRSRLECMLMQQYESDPFFKINAKTLLYHSDYETQLRSSPYTKLREFHVYSGTMEGKSERGSCRTTVYPFIDTSCWRVMNA